MLPVAVAPFDNNQFLTMTGSVELIFAVKVTFSNPHFMVGPAIDAVGLLFTKTFKGRRTVSVHPLFPITTISIW